MQADDPIVKATSPEELTDITIYGATSFVARHVITYMVQRRVWECTPTTTYAPPNDKVAAHLKITLAGRDSEKLTALQTDWSRKLKLLAEATNVPETTKLIEWDVYTAEASEVDELRRMAARTRVVLNCAGPFARYSTSVVAACAEFGTDYVDITGEVSWVGEMRKKYDKMATESGARMVSLCGCDSVPSDLAVYAAVQALRQQQQKNKKTKQTQTQPIVSATTYFSTMGMANGGTLQTMHEMPVDWKYCLTAGPFPYLLEDPLVLCSSEVQNSDAATAMRKRWARAEWVNQIFPFFHTFLKGGFSAPFFMAVTNAKVVYASAVALDYAATTASNSTSEDGKHENFVYYERLFPAGFRLTLQLQTLSLISAVLTHVSIMLGLFLIRLPVIGPLLLNLMGGPGTGMSDAMCSGGYMEVYSEVRGPVNAKTGKVDKANVFLKFKGDPGNWVTAQCVAEAALVLLEDQITATKGSKKSTPKKLPAGFGTPASVMGDELLERLRNSPVRKVDYVSSVRLQTSPNEWKMYP
jgi:short subunit dehydrogenase-like uncharacterized protein